MKGLAERTIVLLIIALIVLGVVGTLIYLGVGPFRESMNYNICYARIRQFCADKPPDTSINLDDFPECQRPMGNRATDLPKTCSQ